MASGLMVRPRHTHQDNQPLVPGEATSWTSRCFPSGMFFESVTSWRSGSANHRLGDPVTRHGDGRPAYQYESAMPPATVTLLRSQQHPSSILLPLLPKLPPISSKPPQPGQQAGISVRQ